MNEHALTVLEYDELLRHLSDYAQSLPGKNAVRELLPGTEKEAVASELALTEEALTVLVDKAPDLHSVEDTSAVTERLKIRGTVLNPLEILQLQSVQKGVGAARDTVRQRQDELPGLTFLIGEMDSFGEWETWVDRSIDGSGDILDSASPELSSVRRKLKSARSSALARLEEFADKPSVRKVLREDYITQRNDRYVVPVKPEYNRSFSGVVQDTSQSGQTLFVEPLFAVELNNRLAQLKGKEEEEIRRILAGMSEQAGLYRAEMKKNLALLARLDLILSKGRLGLGMDGIIPELSDSSTALSQARHPLLLMMIGDSCVPIDIQIGDEINTLVITGPNTGGKTVALKTLGLLTLMVQSGVPVPVADGSRFRVFKKIFADIGDEQSLAQSLSTFSSHMSIISGILSEADDNTLVLLDELGAGTDPQEGSALGIALMGYLSRKNACTVVTTHHNLLKEFAYRTPYAQNASVVFDLETLEPAFQLRMGTPGRSHALEIAGRLGIDEEVIEKAQQVMGSDSVQVDELIGRLSDEVEKESQARKQAENDMDEAKKERERLHANQEKYREEIESTRLKARREAKSLIRHLNERGKALLRELKETGSVSRPRFKGELSELEKEVDRVLPPPPPRIGRGGPVEKGDRVLVVPIDAEGTVTSVMSQGKDAEVQSGGIRMKVAVSDLTPLADPGDIRPDEQLAPRTGYTGDSGVLSELNLLGFTVHEALEAVDMVLDRLILGPGRTLRIIHGKGTGRLREAITESLDKDPRVVSSRPGAAEEGGAGVTVAQVRE
ncbi:MAG: endonuclease MutS2 [bacterium]